MKYIPTQPVLQLITSSLYTPSSLSGDATPRKGKETHEDGMDIDERGHLSVQENTTPYTRDTTYSLVSMFRAEFCRRHGWAKEEPLEVVVDLGSRGGALNAIEKARRVMGDRLGNVRKWTDLPVSHP